MGAYALRRVALLLPTIFGVSVLAFLLSNLTPGDPAASYITRITGNPATLEQIEEARDQLGLERPLPVRYVSWLSDAARGDLGVSYSSRESVTSEVLRRVPYTLQLAVPAALLAVLIAVPAGIVCAVRRNRVIDQVVRIVSLAGASLPSFWVALLLIIVFAVHLHLVPVAGRGGFSALVLPVVTLALSPAATLTRFIRSAVLEALSSDYVVTARAKGLRESLVVSRHALRNSLVPIVTAFGNSLGYMFAGAAVIETIFVWPGVGKLLVDAILQRDYPLITGFILYAGVAYSTLNLAVDLSYATIDPRISLVGAPR
jgi:ABC-type dipeptide/oligopeptide/nickel transport system permease component